MTPWKLPLITELRKRDMLRVQMQSLMGINAGEMCRRIKRMGKVLARRTDGRCKQVFYRLTDDAALVDAFLAAGEPKRIAARGAIERAKADATRHVHIMTDDAPYLVRVHRGLPMADPMALPVAFFRAGQRP